MKSFDGRCVVVTGAASGIGLGLAKAFATHRCNVVMADVEADALSTSAGEVDAMGVDVLSVVADVSNADDMEALASEVSARFGKVHILCLNAGVSRSLGAAWEQTLDDWRWVTGVNYWGVVHGIRSFVPRMISHGEEGHVVVTSSAGGLLPSGSSPIYCATKAAVVAITESIGKDFQNVGAPIGVTLFCPGTVRTKIHSSARNRPERYSSEGAVRSEVAVLAAERARQDRSDLASPEYMAELVLQAVRDNQLYLFPMQDAFRVRIRERLELMLNALDAAPETGIRGVEVPGVGL